MSVGLPYQYVDARLHERRERVFLVLAAVFVGAMAMLNVIGITRFVHIGPLALAVGVLPYPLTFLCTDLISELYGRRRANFVVFTGLIVNGVVIGTVWVAQNLPAMTPENRPEWMPAEAWQPPPWQTIQLGSEVALPNGEVLTQQASLFHLIYACTAGAVLASMVAYLAAQFCDVALFHFWKRVTKGRYFWIRNNGSTMVSQLVDATMVISVTFGMQFLRGERSLGSMGILIGSNYMFKFTVALIDTIPAYILVRLLSRYLRIDPTAEHAIDAEETPPAPDAAHETEPEPVDR